MVEVAGVRLSRRHSVHDATDGAGEQLENRDGHEPEDYDWLQGHRSRLHQLQCQCREDKTQQGAAGVAHEGAYAAIELEGQVKDQEGRDGADHIGSQQLHIEDASGGRQHGQTGERDQARAACKPVEAVEHVEGIDQRDDGDHGERERHPAEVQVTKAEEIAKAGGDEIRAVDEGHGRGEVGEEADTGGKVEAVVQGSEGHHEKSNDDDCCAVVTEACQARSGDEEAREHCDSADNGDVAVMGLAAAGAIDEPHCISKRTQGKEHRAGDEERSDRGRYDVHESQRRRKTKTRERILADSRRIVHLAGMLTVAKVRHCVVDDSIVWESNSLSVIAAPDVKAGLGEPVLAAQLLHRHAGLRLLEEPDDLLFGIPLLHSSNLRLRVRL